MYLKRLLLGVAWSSGLSGFRDRLSIILQLSTKYRQIPWHLIRCKKQTSYCRKQLRKVALLYKSKRWQCRCTAAGQSLAESLENLEQSFNHLHEDSNVKRHSIDCSILFWLSFEEALSTISRRCLKNWLDPPAEHFSSCLELGLLQHARRAKKRSKKGSHPS